MKNKSFLKSRPVTATFAVLAFLAGFSFLNQSFTGNVILTNNPSFVFISLIGFVLLICAIILALYSIRNK